MPAPAIPLLLGAGLVLGLIALGGGTAKASPADTSALEAERSRMPEETRNFVDGLLANSTDPKELVNAAAVLLANGFPITAKLLSDRAVEVNKGSSTEPKFTTQPVGPGVPVADDTNAFKAELSRMPDETRRFVLKLLASTNPNDVSVMVQAAAQLQANGFPISASKLTRRAIALTPVPVAQEGMELSLKLELAEALSRLNAQPDGSVQPPIGKEDIQFATSVAGRLEREGFEATSVKLRTLIVKASKLVASPPPEEQVVIPGLSPEMLEKINRALQFERDPARLRVLVLALRSVPPSQQRDLMIAALEALILQIEAKNAADEAAREADRILKGKKKKVPGIVSPGLPQPPGQQPPIVTLPRPDVPRVVVPDVPRPQPVPLPTGPEVQKASALAAHLNQLQSTHGMPKAKGRQDALLVKSFQTLQGEKADGLPGPNTFRAMARLGVSRLPIVMYWPKSATLSDVDNYRQDLLTMADAVEAAGQPQRAAELRQSAEREKGQGGVVPVQGVLRQSSTGTAAKREIAKMPAFAVKSVHDALASNSASKMQQTAAALDKQGFSATANKLREQSAKTKISGGM